MSKGWKIVSAIVLVLILLGAICIGVGFMTGGSLAEVYSKLDQEYKISLYWDHRSEYVQWARDAYGEIVKGLTALQ
jgi:hypothetical protein